MVDVLGIYCLLGQVRVMIDSENESFCSSPLISTGLDSTQIILSFYYKFVLLNVAFSVWPNDSL